MHIKLDQITQYGGGSSMKDIVDNNLFILINLSNV